MHAEIRIGDSFIFLSEEYPNVGQRAKAYFEQMAQKGKCSWRPLSEGRFSDNPSRRRRLILDRRRGGRDNGAPIVIGAFPRAFPGENPHDRLLTVRGAGAAARPGA
jgi:hypothetical protein